MILQGSQRGGPLALAKHLTNTRENDHVELHEIKGLAAEDLRGALLEIDASRGATKTRKTFYHLSLNPPAHALPSTADFLSAIEAAEQHLRLEGQPRAVVFHEKKGRRHAHVVWSRIDHETGRTKKISFDKRWLQKLSINLYQKHGWEMPAGFAKGPADDPYNLKNSKASPLNYRLDEWMKSLRNGTPASEHKKIINSLYGISEDLPEFRQALGHQGYTLAQGRRGYVAVDLDGEIHSVMRAVGKRKKDVEAKLGDPKNLPAGQELITAEQAQSQIQVRRTQAIEQYVQQVKTAQQKQIEPYRQELSELRQQQRFERGELKSRQHERERKNETAWADRYRSGVMGFWDKLTGRKKRITEAIRCEREAAQKRAREEKDTLVHDQIQRRRLLQLKVERLARQHALEIREVRNDIAALMKFDVGSKMDLAGEHNRQAREDRDREQLEQQRQAREDKQQQRSRRTRSRGLSRKITPEQNNEPDPPGMG